MQQVNFCAQPEEQRSEIGAIPFAMKSAIADIGCWAPPTVVTTEEIEAEIREFYPYKGFSLAGVTGVKERRYVSDSDDILSFSLRAVEALQFQTPFDPSSIDVVIFAGVGRDYIEPATATLIARELGIQAAIAFDVSSACLGFVDAMMIADAMIATNRCGNALVVSAEVGSKAAKNGLLAIKNGEPFYNAFPALTLGDASAAALIQPAGTGRNRCLAGVRASFPEFSSACMIPATKLDDVEMYTDPKRLFSGALKHMPELYRSLTEAIHWHTSEVDALIPHQASEKIMLEGAHMVQIPAERIVSTVEHFGNLASVSVPFTIAHALKTGRVSPGKKAIVAGFGSGLGVGLIAIRG